ncbi:MAG: GspL/Epsl periplasmic domain-containing protein, partial [Desulfobulbaceae bacterium]|nr:GspL/Epsl periplasmic domain-containing protein [Desulfobulbaceae bacterium]
MNTILGIDISPLSVNVVVVGQRFNRRWIEGCRSIPHTGGNTIAAALAEAVSSVEGSDLSAISALSARDISFHSLTMPFSSIAKIRQVIAYELEPRLLVPLDEVQFDLCSVSRDSDQSTIMAVVASRNVLDYFLGRLQDTGLDLLVVDVRNHALALQIIPCCRGHETIVLLDIEESVLTICHQGVVLLHRPLPQRGPAAVCDLALLRGVVTTLHACGVENGLDLRPTRVFLTGVVGDEGQLVETIADQFSAEVVVLDLAAELSVGCRPEAESQWRPQVMNTALALALRGVKGQNGFNFLSGDYLPARSTLPYAKELRKGIVWVSLIIALLVLQQGLTYRDLTRRYHDLDLQTRQIFQRVFPSSPLKVDPLLQMQAKMKEVQQTKGSGINVSGVTVLDLLTEISARTSLSWKVQFVALIVDAETIQIKGVTDN